MAEGIEYVIESSRRRIIDLKEIWQYRELFYFFTWRDIKVKYKQTVLGVIWVVLQPVLTVAIFSLFFGRALNVPSAGLPYPVFVFSGLLLWNVFSASINTAGNSMLTHAPIIKKIYFPRIIIPVSSILVALVDFCIAFIVFLMVSVYYHVKVDFVELLIFWPSAIFLMLSGSIGISCWLAALSVKYRDFRFVIPFVLQIALFVSPVIYPASVIGNSLLNYVFALNPMYGAIMFFRAPITSTPLENILVLISVISTLSFLVLGIYYFKKTEAYFADIS
ncbi:ABC transporter permease [Chryseosolibacter indicus]|uniref:Transport permease protein n=1 Tax=Chryseosolibacter indicus TaxID=2782351 RepID=A0ABS5VLN6_9BACT|nr:ABC transporter permease [Chryseosolibacter indicus]MBT1702026.1 ABC transporter permease [Chryseosolibacter indicus]